jgi:orotate phosphoribosyltransferase/AMMECR1 domain-containing protein
MLREALSATLSELPPQFHAERAELLELLRRVGILHRSPTQPVLSRDGTSARWMLDSLSVTLTPRGAELAGRCVLELLKRFDGRQIATYGLTAVPILQACLLQSGGRFRGLLVRKERKAHGSLKLIEGPIDKAEPVILIDDSVSSGMSMEEACARLEEHGLRVEGGVCLVRFGWDGGYASMQERGYHVEAVYDIWDDFIYHMEDEYKPPANPTKCFPDFEWSDARAPEGLHPAELARFAMSEFLTSGRLPRAPERLDAEYDSTGGAWVSVRSRKDIHLRHAREGFWHFPCEARGTTAEDVLMASLLTAVRLPEGRDGLEVIEQSGIAVTFFTALERCTVGQLDNDRYGIVVRSLERPSQMGGALPRMPGITNEWHQFQHARRKNGGLLSFEPYEIYRHDVIKAIEPEMNWQPTGVPSGDKPAWHENREVCTPLAARARAIAISRLVKHTEATSALLASDEMSASDETREIDSLYVTVYVKGRLRGCMGGAVHELEADLQRFTVAALDDARFDADTAPTDADDVATTNVDENDADENDVDENDADENDIAATDVDDVAVSVSLLFHPLEIGECTPEEVVQYVRHGQQALMAYQGESVGLMLPFVASMFNLDALGLAHATLQKAELTEPPFYWCRFDCVTWLADACGVHRLVGGFALTEAPPTAGLNELLTRRAELHTQYLLRHQRPDGTLFTEYEPFQNRLYEGIDLPRQAHAAWVLARTSRIMRGEALEVAADKAIEYLLRAATEGEDGLWLEAPGHTSSVAELAFLLLALCERRDARGALHPLAGRIAATLWNRVSLPHGRVDTHRSPDESADEFQDYYAGQALLALGAAAEPHISDADHVFAADEEKLRGSFLYYRHRFRYKRNFGQVSWYAQAFARWWRVTRDERFAAFVFEITDWILNYQQEHTGAFINDHQPETPGYTTAVYLEGVGAALNLATALADEQRRHTYTQAYTRGLRFLDRLVIQTRDASLLPSPDYAIGGLRRAIHYSEIRTDFVQHALSAVLECYDLSQ